MKRIATILSLLFALSITGTTGVTAVNSAAWDYKVPHSAAANQASFWVNHFEDAGYTNVSCNKYGESHSGWLPGNYEAGIIKAGQWNYVWLQPDSTGRQLNAPQDLSHIFKCNFRQPPPPPTWDPNFDLMVCGDPRLLLTLTNDSDFPVTYYSSFRSGKKGVGRVFFRTTVAAHSEKQILRWVKGQSYFRLVARPKANLSFPAIYDIPSKEVLYGKRLPAAQPWGQGSCPASLKAAQRWAGR